jgi:hypothetical protein
MDPIADIKRLYYGATRTSIDRDLTRAVALLKTLTTEEERERAAVYMDGLSQMRSEWHEASAAAAPQGTAKSKRPAGRSAPAKKA